MATLTDAMLYALDVIEAAFVGHSSRDCQRGDADERGCDCSHCTCWLKDYSEYDREEYS